MGSGHNTEQGLQFPISHSAVLQDQEHGCRLSDQGSEREAVQVAPTQASRRFKTLTTSQLPRLRRREGVKLETEDLVQYCVQNPSKDLRR